MGSLRSLGYILGLFLGVTCAVLHADPDPPTRVSELSPLARVLDRLLFGDGARDLSSYDRNLFTGILVDEDKFKRALKDVFDLRKEEGRKLKDQGFKVHANYVDALQQRARELVSEEGLNPTAIRDTAAYFLQVTAGQKDGEGPLSPSDVATRADNTTREIFPQAFFSGGQGLSDPFAKDTYLRQFHRIETFETQPKATTISREDFESWREREIRRLTENLRNQVIRMAQADARLGLGLTVYKIADGAQKPTKMTAEEIGSAVPPFDVNRVVRGNKVTYEIPKQFDLDLSGHSLVFDLPGLMRPNRKGTHYANMGAIDIDKDTEVLLSHLLAISNLGALRMIQAINDFQYDQYKQDRGRSFLDKAKRLERETAREFTSKWRVPPTAVSLPHLAELGDGIEIALWGKFEKDPSFWDAPHKLGFFRDFLQLPVRFSQLSDEPPKPWLERLIRAKDSTLQMAKRFSLVPAAIGALWFGADWFMDLPLSEEVGSPIAALAPDHNLEPNDNPATNKALPSEKENQNLFLLDSKKAPETLPRRFSNGKPSKAVVPVSVPATSADTVFSVNSTSPHLSVKSIPTGDGSQLSSLRVTGKDGREWAPGVDYTLRATEEGEVVIFPKTYDAYTISAGFAEKAKDSRPIQHAELRAMNLDRLDEIARNLRAHHFTYLPDLLEQATAFSRARKRPLTLFDLEELLRRSAFYTQASESKKSFADRATEMEKATRFLNPEGVACYMCDGAAELGVTLFREQLPNRDEFEIRKRSVLTRKEGSFYLTKNGLHADIFIGDNTYQQDFLLDTTPPSHDPRDKTTITPDQVGYVDVHDRSINLPSAIFPPIPQPEKSNEPAKVTAHETVKEKANEPEAAKPEPSRAYPPLPYAEILKRLTTIWHHAMSERPKLTKVPRVDTVSGPPSGDTEEKPRVNEMPSQAPKVSSVEPVTQWQLDPKISALHDRVTQSARHFASLGVVPKKLPGGGFAPIPSANVVRLGRFLESLLNREITLEEFEKETAFLAPEDFTFPRGSLDRKVKALVAAARKKQLGILDSHRELWEKQKTKEYPRMLNPSVGYEVNQLLNWIEERTWSEPELVTMCERVARAAGSP